MNYRILTFAVAAIGAVAGLTFGTFLWTIRSWAPPEAPVLYLGIAMLLLFALAGVIWFQVTRSELASAQVSKDGVSAQTEGLRRLVGMASLVVLGAIGLGLAGTWLSPQVRANLVPYASEDRSQLEAALDDPSALVREEACLQLIEIGVTRSEKSLAAALHSNPESAVSCLEKARERGYNGTERVARRLAQTWESQLLGSPKEEKEVACGIASQLPEIRKISGQNSISSLLTCALAADALDVRLCCASEIQSGEGTLADALGPASDYPVEEGERVFMPLVDFTFRPLSLPIEQQDVASALESDHEANRKWAVEFGCSLVPDPDRRRTVVEGMLPIIEGGTCNLDEAAQFAFLEATQWVYLCDELSLASDVPIEQAICDVFTGSLVERAVAEASSQVHSASRARYLSDAADALEAPLPRSKGGGGTSTKSGKHSLGYDVLGSGRQSGAPPVGAMCKKTEYKLKPGFIGQVGQRAGYEVETIVPCSSLRNPWAGKSARDIRAEQDRKRKALLEGAVEDAIDRERKKQLKKRRGSGAYNKAAKRVQRDFDQGVSEGTK